MLVLIWIAALVAAVALYLRQVYSKLSQIGINNLPVVPGFGNMARVLFRKEHTVDSVMRLYNAFPNDRVVGHYEFFNPVIYIRDLELVKKITVKDFEHFVDRRSFVDEKTDELFGRNLLSLKGQEWKDMRSTLSPAFTSSKIRLMVPFMVEVGEQMIIILKKRLQNSSTGYIDVEGKDLATRYANDVIASCAFGLRIDSQAEDNHFYTMCNEVTNFTFMQLLKVFAYFSCPGIMKFFKVQFFPKKLSEFFKKVVLSTIQHREERNIVRNDMINLLIEAKKGHLTHDSKVTNDASAGFATVEESSVGTTQANRVWSDNDLVAQAVIFLVAGFDTVSTAMAFLLHELAVNPDVQERLAREIRDTHERNSGKFDYDSIQHMTYLDMVTSEVLRLWPGAPVTDRMCVKEYNIGRPNSKSTKDYIVRKGEYVQIPMWAFHHDPEFYPDPYKFDPERFSEENKHKIKPYSYMPFGLGPRNCIGSRFALCELKVMVYQLFQHMEVSPCEKTCIPAKLSSNGFIMRIEGGHWVRMKTRQWT